MLSQTLWGSIVDAQGDEAAGCKEIEATQVEPRWQIVQGAGECASSYLYLREVGWAESPTSAAVVEAAVAAVVVAGVAAGEATAAAAACPCAAAVGDASRPGGIQRLHASQQFLKDVFCKMLMDRQSATGPTFRAASPELYIF